MNLGNYYKGLQINRTPHMVKKSLKKLEKRQEILQKNRGQIQWRQVIIFSKNPSQNG